MLSVPFTIGNAHRGASDMRGCVYVDGEDLVIEMQVKLWNLFKRPTQTFRFHLTDLEEVRHKPRWTGDTVTLRSRPMDLVAAVPGAHGGALALRTRRRDRPALRAFLDRLDLWIVA